MVAVEGKLSPRILGGKRCRGTTSVSAVASHNEQRSLTNDQYDQGWIADAVVSLCRGGENIRSIPVVQSSESPYNFVASCLCGENNSIGSGGDSRCDGISADNIVVADCLNNIGLDQFGRIANQNWVNSTGATVDGYTYTYDQNSNVTAKNNVLNSAYSETYTYDVLNRLTAVKRNGAAYQSWNLDSQGNWSSSTTGTVTQTETANAQNQITSITGTTGTPAYDSNGKPGDLLRSAPGFRHPCLNMTTDQAGNKLVYDAWNRLVSVTNSAGQMIAQYSYNAMGWRVTSYHPTAGPGGTAITENIYYSAGWQRIETRVNGNASTDVASQYVWSASYVDGLVLRDSYANGALQASSRVYALQDADWNVTALITFDSGTNTWAVSERFVFDSYGKVQTFNANWQATPDTLGWQVLAQGRFRDLATGLDDGRARIYSASLGRWISEDPAGYIDGASTYQYEVGGPVGNTDAGGLGATKPGCDIPEIAPQLREIRTRLIQRFFGETMAQQQAFIVAMSPANPVAAARVVIGSWDMTPLAGGKRYAVVGKVYHGQDVNYWLYGIFFRLITIWAQREDPSGFDPGQILPPTVMNGQEISDLQQMEKTILAYRLFAWLKLHQKIHFGLKVVWGEAGYENDLFLPAPTAIGGNFHTKFEHTKITARLSSGQTELSVTAD